MKKNPFEYGRVYSVGDGKREATLQGIYMGESIDESTSRKHVLVMRERERVIALRFQKYLFKEGRLFTDGTKKRLTRLEEEYVDKILKEKKL